MKKIILSIQLLFCGLVIFGQPAATKNLNVPEFKFTTEIIDYGTIEKGANGVREFHFTNTGNAPIIISDAKKSCGCTIPTWPKEPIMPGESSVIKVKYATNRLGIINKTVTLISNAKRQSIVLRIKGKVVEKPTSFLKKVEGKPIAK